MYSKLLFEKDARLEMAKGVSKLVKAVKVTLGGDGKNVAILNKTDQPHITKDGVTVARNILLRNDVQQGGVNIVRQAAMNAARETGDGTTTATIIAGYLIEKGIDLIDTENIQKLRSGMDFAFEKISNEISELSKECVTEDILINIATISANGDKKIGEIVGSNIFKLGCNSKYTVEEISDNTGLTFEKVEGYNYEKQMTLHFENIPGSGKTIFENPRILIIDGYLGDKTKLYDIVKFSETNKKLPIVILYKDIDALLLNDLAKKFNNKTLNIVTVQLPDYGDLQDYAVKDLSVCTGAKPIDSLSATNPTEEHLGFADYFEINGNEIKFLFNEKYKESIKELSNNLKKSLDEAKEENVYLFKNRYERTSGGGGTFKIGRPTDIDRKEIRDKVDDAIGSVVSALKEGFVPGGGIALLKVSEKLKDEKFLDNSFQKGFDLVINACIEPFKQILFNCGVEDLDEIIIKIKESNYELGYNAKEKELQNLIEKGIIDATMVVKVSLASAISSAIGLLTTDCVIYPEDNEI